MSSTALTSTAATGGGIIAVSGDRLSITLPQDSVNRVTDGDTDILFNAAIFSPVDLDFGGPGMRK